MAAPTAVQAPAAVTNPKASPTLPDATILETIRGPSWNQGELLHPGTSAVQSGTGIHV
jgi:hypothetical protein